MSALEKDAEPLVQPTTAFFLGLVCAFIGLLLGIGDRARFPAESVSELPAEEDRKAGQVYYIPGSDRSSGSVERLQRGFLEGSSPLTLIEGDINTWASRSLPFPSAMDDEDKSFAAAGGPPNVKFGDGSVQVAIPLKVRLFGRSNNVMYVGRGTYINESGGPVLETHEASIGSAPIPGPLAGVSAWLISRLYRDAEGASELERAWDAYSSATVENGKLVLRRE